MPDSNTSDSKVCTKCGEDKPRVDFYHQHGRRDGLRSCCKACHAAYHTANRERLLANRAARYKVERTRILAQNAAWRAANREREAARALEWREAHPEQRAAYTRNRMARKKGNGGAHTASDIQAQYERQKGKCFYCGVKVGDEYHVDHVIPISKGGSNGPENLVIACPFCNMRKHDKHPMNFCGRML